MSLNPGTKLGPYEILAPLGAGGMGEVYKARDTRLDRTVAIKVLPSHVASNPEVRQRFEREARAVSSLNHLHICTLHDIGSENGIDFMVMEHIEGDTLADRLKKGALPLEQALQHGIEIADALDKAHRQGVVHRDLKPGNIMLTKSGAKLLDFGLAKLTVEPIRDASGMSALPTEAKPLTQEGSILGTFQYMAPEQLEGKEADARTDIFAFGSVLYEMVTGRRAFEGKSQASLIAAILEHEPPAMSTLQTMTPPVLDHVVRMCLAKDPDERWQSASDVMRQLKWVTGAGSSEAADSPGKTQSRRVPGLAIGTPIGVLLGGLAVWALVGSDQIEPTRRLSLNLPADAPLSFFDTAPSRIGCPALALSSDGRFLVYVAEHKLYLRPMDRNEATPIPGTEGAYAPFFSPDGEWVGFFAGDQLKKVGLSGSLPVVLSEARQAFGASWSLNGEIISSIGDGRAVVRIPALGGMPESVPFSDEIVPRWPWILPGGRAFLASYNAEGIVAVSLDTGESAVLLEGGGDDPRYLPMFAAPFDRVVCQNPIERLHHY